jgi:hypothetical protein
VPVIGRRLCDDADRAARMNHAAIGAAHFDEGDDLSADGKNEVRIG